MSDRKKPDEPQSLASAGRYSRAEIRRADDTSKRIRRVLASPPSLEHALQSVTVLANSLQEALDQFAVDWIDKPADQLRALHNLSAALAASAEEVRNHLTIAIAIAVEFRLQAQADDRLDDVELAALCEEVTAALQRMDRSADGVDRLREEASAARTETPHAQADPGAASAAPDWTLAPLEARDQPGPSTEAAPATSRPRKGSADEPVLANRRTGVYHPAGSPTSERLATADRVVFANAEAAERAGFRPATGSKPPTRGD